MRLGGGLGPCVGLEQRSATFLAPGTGVTEDSFPTDGVWGVEWGGMAQVVMPALGAWQMKLRSPPAVRSGTGPRPRGWGPLA